MLLQEEQKIKIQKALNEHLGTAGNPLVCPMCGQNKFTMTDGYFMSIVQSDLKKLELGGVSIPTVSIICNNCGFVSQHAMGVLGLLPKKSQGKKKGGEG